MSKSSKKYYAVAAGRRPGLYHSWSGESGAEEQIKGYAGARHKGFHDINDALDYLDQHGIKVPEQKYRIPAEPDEFIHIYTDGGAINNPGPGAYGVVITHLHNRKEFSKGFRKTTNNRMELLACITGLQALKKSSRVKIFSDSKYIVDSVTQGWLQRWRTNGWVTSANKVVENVDLWEKLDKAISKHDVTFIWVKGHAGKSENERCDQLVRQAIQKSKLEIDMGYEQ